MALKYNNKYVKIHSIYKTVLKANFEKIDWRILSKNPAAIELLTANQDKIDWEWLSSNPVAVELLAANQDKIEWTSFCEIPFLEYDYDRIKRIHFEINRGLHEYFYHPRFIQKWLDDGNDIEDYMN